MPPEISSRAAFKSQRRTRSWLHCRSLPAEVSQTARQLVPPGKRGPMGKKCSILGCFGMYLLFSTVSSATTAPATSTPSASDTNATESMLGMVEGVRYYCDKFVPGSARIYGQIDELYVSSQTAKVLSPIRNSATYLNAQNQIQKQLKALPSKELSSVCKAN